MDKKGKETDILTLESTSKVSDNNNLTALVAPTAKTNLNQCMYLLVMYLQTPNKTLYKPRYLRVTLVKLWRHLVVCMWKCFFGIGPSHFLRHQTLPGSPPDSKRHHGRVHRPTWVRNNCINQTHILFFLASSFVLLTSVKNRVSSFVTQLLLYLRLHSWDLTLADVDGAAEEMPELSDGDDDDDVDDEEQWQWMEEDSQPVTCLFCDRWDHPALAGPVCHCFS